MLLRMEGSFRFRSELCRSSSAQPSRRSSLSAFARTRSHSLCQVSGMFRLEIFDQLPFFAAVYADEGERHVVNAKGDQPPPQRGDHVIVLFRNAGLKDVQFTRVQTDAVVEFLRCRILRLAVRQKNLGRAHFENDVADVRIADVAEILRREQNDSIHPSQRLQPVAEPLPEDIVSQICPRFVERYQCRRAVESLFNPAEQVQEDRDHGLVVELEQVLRFEGQEPAGSENVFVGIEQLAERTGQRVELECLTNVQILNVGAEFGERA